MRRHIDDRFKLKLKNVFGKISLVYEYNELHRTIGNMGVFKFFNGFNRHKDGELIEVDLIKYDDYIVISEVNQYHIERVLPINALPTIINFNECDGVNYDTKMFLRHEYAEIGDLFLYHNEFATRSEHIIDFYNSLDVDEQYRLVPKSSYVCMRLKRNVYTRVETDVIKRILVSELADFTIKRDGAYITPLVILDVQTTLSNVTFLGDDDIEF